MTLVRHNQAKCVLSEQRERAAAESHKPSASKQEDISAAASRPDATADGAQPAPSGATGSPTTAICPVPTPAQTHACTAVSSHIVMMKRATIRHEGVLLPGGTKEDLNSISIRPIYFPCGGYCFDELRGSGGVGLGGGIVLQAGRW